MEDLEAQLLTEQISRLKDSIESRFQRLEKDLNHHATLETEKMNLIKSEIAAIRKTIDDHESRIRTVDDSVISNKTTTTLIQAGQAALTLIAAAIAAYMGSK
jgi:DNA replication initiation complex subunit (GINS family)